MFASYRGTLPDASSASYSAAARPQKDASSGSAGTRPLPLRKVTSSCRRCFESPMTAQKTSFRQMPRPSHDFAISTVRVKYGRRSVRASAMHDRRMRHKVGPVVSFFYHPAHPSVSMLFRRPLRHVARLSALPPLGILSTPRQGVASCPEHRFRLVGIDVGRNHL